MMGSVVSSGQSRQNTTILSSSAERCMKTTQHQPVSKPRPRMRKPCRRLSIRFSWLCDYDAAMFAFGAKGILNRL